MNKKKCIILRDFLCCAGIIVKKGTICEVLKDDKVILWISPYIEEVGDEIPIPILKGYVAYF